MIYDGQISLDKCKICGTENWSSPFRGAIMSTEAELPPGGLSQTSNHPLRAGGLNYLGRRGSGGGGWEQGIKAVVIEVVAPSQVEGGGGRNGRPAKRATEDPRPRSAVLLRVCGHWQPRTLRPPQGRQLFRIPHMHERT